MQTIRLLVSVVLLLLCVQSSFGADGNSSVNVDFSSADLTVEYETNGGGWARIEAFKAPRNDAIMSTYDTSRYNQLNWLSIGAPKLVSPPDPYNRSQHKQFVLKSEGFDVYVGMLTNEQRELFQKAINKKHHISVERDQILNLALGEFRCSLLFYVGEEKAQLSGRVSQFYTMPLRMHFAAPVGTKERVLLEKRLKLDGVTPEQKYSGPV